MANKFQLNKYLAKKFNREFCSRVLSVLIAVVKSKVFWYVISLIIVTAIWLNFDFLSEKLHFTQISKFLLKKPYIIWGMFFLIATFLIIWILPKWQIKSLKDKKGNTDQSEFDMEKERIELRDELRKTIAQILGGAFFVFGLVVTYNTFQLNSEEQVTNRFYKSVELLSNQSMSVRISGMYALNRVAKDSPEEYISIRKILLTYIREKSPADIKSEEKINNNSNSSTNSNKSENVNSGKKEEVDIKTEEELCKHPVEEIFVAAKIISDLQDDPIIINFLRDEQKDTTRLDFSGLVLCHAQLEEAKFQNALFTNSNLSFDNFKKSQLNGANFSGTTLNNANLQGANLAAADFNETKLILTDLRGAKLNATKNATFEQLSKAIIDETTVLPDAINPRRDELLEITKRNSANSPK